MSTTITDLAQEERQDLAGLLETLTPEQWDAPSLCASWRVRDVVSHLVSYDGIGAPTLVKRLARGRLSLARTNSLGLDAQRDLDPEQLVSLLRQHARPAGLSTVFGGRVVLVDSLIHHQDIRRPLGLPREIPPERLEVALPFAFLAPPLRAPWHTRGVRLVATDLAWSAGAGPEARGSAEALLMAMGGRRGAAQELTGPGAARLAQRLG